MTTARFPLELQGMDRIVKSLTAIGDPKFTERVFQNAFRAGARTMVKSASYLAPERKRPYGAKAVRQGKEPGLLKKSIRVARMKPKRRTGKFGTRMTTGQRYGGLVEWGTKHFRGFGFMQKSFNVHRDETLEKTKASVGRAIARRFVMKQKTTAKG
jgi:hypothetical protein